MGSSPDPSNLNRNMPANGGERADATHETRPASADLSHAEAAMNIAVTPPETSEAQAASARGASDSLPLKDARDQVMRETGAIPTGPRAGSRKVYVPGQIHPDIRVP